MSSTSRLAAANKVFQASTKLAEKRASRVKGLPRPESRMFSFLSSATSKFITSSKNTANEVRLKTVKFLGGEQRANLAFGVTGGLLLAGLHSATGSENEFYDYRFVLRKDADDLASFYGGEEFMELFCIFPFVGQIMMRSGYFDDEGNVITQGIPGTMKVSMVFSDETFEESGKTAWFNKRERFRNTLFGFTMWDMVCNFGFRTLEDGTLEGYHVGEYFHGNLPIVSQVMKLVFQIHSRWLAWATEHHLNHYAFDAEEDWEEEMEIESRHNMPLFLLQNYFWKDLVAMFFGVEIGSKEDKEASFLLQRRPSLVDLTEDAEDMEEEEEDEEEEEVEEVDEEELKRKEAAAKLLPFQRRESMIQIAADIAADRAAVKQLLARDTSGDDTKVVLARQTTVSNLARNGTESKGNFYGLAMEGAKARQLQRKQSMADMKAELQRRESSAAMNIPMDQLKRSKADVVAVAAEPSEKNVPVVDVPAGTAEEQVEAVAVTAEAAPAETIHEPVVAAAATEEEKPEENVAAIAAPVPTTTASPVPTQSVESPREPEPAIQVASEVAQEPATEAPAVVEPTTTTKSATTIPSASVIEEIPPVVATAEAPRKAVPAELVVPPQPVRAVTPAPAVVAVAETQMTTQTAPVAAVAVVEAPVAAVTVAEFPQEAPTAAVVVATRTNQHRMTPPTVQAAKQHYQDRAEVNLLNDKIAHLEAAIEKKESALLKDKVARLEAIIESMQSRA